MKSHKLTVSFMQYSIDSDAPDKNVKKIFLFLKLALKNKSDLVLLPEMCLGTPSSIKCRYFYESEYKKIITQLQDFAREHKMAFYGSFLEAVTGTQKYFNTALFIDTTGKIQARYRKIHLFRFEGEHRKFSEGTKSVIFNSMWGKVALQICYDIRFPELMRQQVFSGAQFAVVCAQWPKSRREHWLTLLKARAIENQIFVLACNRLGTKGKLEYAGDSCIISPWGEVLLHLNSRKNFGTCQIDLSDVLAVRKKFPFLKSALQKKFYFDV